MKKQLILLISLLFIALCLNVFGQTKSYPFQIKQSGQGKKTIIFIPGFACSGEVWNDTKVLFEKDYTCYTLTMAGFAGTPPQKEITFVNWKKGIAEYIKDQHIEKPILIGHSMGGGLAMAIAADYPELVGKIVVVDALPCLAALTDPTFKSKATNDCNKMISQMTSISDNDFYNMQVQSMPRLMEDTVHRALAIGWSLKSDRKTFAGMYCDFSNTDLREAIKTVQCPSVILLESYFVNFKPGIEEQFKNLKSAKLVYANKGLHFIMYDDPQWYKEQLTKFMAIN